VQHVILHDNLGVADLASNQVAAAVRLSHTTGAQNEKVEAFKP
jgi:acetoacetyl-CoA synthetase